MAGRERQGPEAAQADLFRGKPCVLTPEPGTQPETMGTVRSLWETLGMRIVEMDAVEHDRQVAVVSHLPHATAATLVLAAERLGGMEIASSGFEDTTRVAGGDPEMWRDIFLSNRDGVCAAIDQFMRELTGFRALVAEGRADQVLETLKRSKTTHDRWLEKR
jgi:prephenate dehydrogenase